MYNTTQNSTIQMACLFLKTTFNDNSEMYGALVFSSVLNSILAVTASLFNALVLLTIWKKPSLHTPANLLLACLAISDLSVGVLVQPLSALYVIVHLQKRLIPYCILGLLTEGLGLLLTGVSLLTLTAISVEKYIAISFHLRYKQIVTVGRTKKVMCLLWVVPICSVAYRFLYENFIMLMSLGSSGLAICIIIIFFCNVSIGRALRRLTLCVHPQSTHLSTAIGIARFKKSVLTLLSIVGLFVLCYIPYGFSMMLAIKYGFPVWIRRISYVTFPFIFLNSTLNPVLYWWRIQELRSATLEMILSLWSKVQSKKKCNGKKTTKLEDRVCMGEKNPGQINLKKNRKSDSLPAQMKSNIHNIEQEYTA